MSLRVEDVLRYDVTSNKLVPRQPAKRERYIMYVCGWRLGKGC